MGEKLHQFRLARTRQHWLRLGLSVAYLVWGIAFIIIGLQPRPTEAVSATLVIPAISLEAPVSDVELVNHQFAVPSYNAGAYQPSSNKIFLMGHKSTVFSNLHQVQVGDQLTYNHLSYTVTSKQYQAKSAVDMSAVLAEASSPTLVIMTCAGQQLSDSDFSHRLILTAEASSL